MENKVYWANEVATILNVSRSTLRKWSLALEAEGYAFARDEHDRRCYVERDIPVFRKMKVMLDDGMTMENAATVAKALYEKEKEDMSGSVSMVVHADNKRSDERYLELVTQFQDMRSLLERMETQMIEQQAELRQQLADQQQYIEESLNRRDELLMKTVREALEERQKKWWQFWK